jgi:hypothetical protein
VARDVRVFNLVFESMWEMCFFTYGRFWRGLFNPRSKRISVFLDGVISRWVAPSFHAYLFRGSTPNSWNKVRLDRSLRSNGQAEVAMKEFLIPVSFLCLLGFPGSAEQNQPQASSDSKPAWQWTTEERLAARFAPGAAARRAAAARGSLNDGNTPVYDCVDGAKTPALFLPIELYRNFIPIMFDPELDVSSAATRKDIRSKWQALGLPSDPEVLLRGEAQQILAFLEEDRRRSLEAIRTALARGEKREVEYEGRAQARQVWCKLLRDSLVAAQEAVRSNGGGDGFLRLLYETVAPVAKVIGSNPGQEADLRREERGCQ